MFIEVNTITKDTLKDVLPEFDYKLISLFGTEFLQGIKLTSTEIINLNFVSRIYVDKELDRTVLEFSEDFSIHIVESMEDLSAIINGAYR